MQAKEPDRVRAAGVVIRDDELLLMFRRKNGREYYTFPGGGVEERESSEDAVVREIREETTIEVKVENLLYELRRERGNAQGGFPAREFFYRCTYIRGTPALASDSIERRIFDADNNYFEPLWIRLSELNIISLLPPEIATRFLHDLEHGFQDVPVVLDETVLS